MSTIAGFFIIFGNYREVVPTMIVSTAPPLEGAGGEYDFQIIDTQVLCHTPQSLCDSSPILGEQLKAPNFNRGQLRGSCLIF